MRLPGTAELDQASGPWPESQQRHQVQRPSRSAHLDRRMRHLAAAATPPQNREPHPQRRRPRSTALRHSGGMGPGRGVNVVPLGGREFLLTVNAGAAVHLSRETRPDETARSAVPGWHLRPRRVNSRGAGDACADHRAGLHDRDGARREDAVKHGVQQAGQTAAHLGRGRRSRPVITGLPGPARDRALRGGRHIRFRVSHTREPAYCPGQGPSRAVPRARLAARRDPAGPSKADHTDHPFVRASADQYRYPQSQP